MIWCMASSTSRKMLARSTKLRLQEHNISNSRRSSPTCPAPALYEKLLVLDLHEEIIRVCGIGFLANTVSLTCIAVIMNTVSSQTRSLVSMVQYRPNLTSCTYDIDMRACHAGHYNSDNVLRSRPCQSRDLRMCTD